MPELKLTQIWIYPIKSLGGISLASANVMQKGLQYDRRWMLVDEEGKFLTQRVYPRMALFKLALDKDQLIIKHFGDTLMLPVEEKASADPIAVTIWDDRVSAYEVDRSYSKWFSDLLGLKCKLVFFPEENSRPVDPTYNVNDDQVSLADAYPFLIIGQSSLDDLNSRLKEPLPINRFRPNLVFTGGKPYEEDTWRNFAIGSTRFVGVKPCDRCVLTTVNQDTAEKGAEPLKTLATYRKKNNKISFGQNLVALDYGKITVGNIITLQ
jgi:uncharacterized protein YcbX